VFKNISFVFFFKKESSLLTGKRERETKKNDDKTLDWWSNDHPNGFSETNVEQ
jgi:hypothetical protein